MTAPKQQDREALVQMRLAHLNMIQGVISRMSGFSASAKNFCITVMAALVAVAFQKPIPELIWAGIAVPIFFLLMDAYYLALEKRYRDLYERTASAELTAAGNMSLKASRLTLRRFLESLLSLSVAGVYAVLLVGMSGLMYLAAHGQSGPAPLVSDSRPVRGAIASAGQPVPVTPHRGNAGATSVGTEPVRVSESVGNHQ